MRRYNLIALTNAEPGREDEFDDWYTNIHLADVAKLPGVVAAQRFALDDVQHQGGQMPWNYMAAYEIDIDDISITLSALRAATGTEVMPFPPALQDERTVWIYKPITGRVAA